MEGGEGKTGESRRGETRSFLSQLARRGAKARGEEGDLECDDEGGARQLLEV